ncbi:MULTISPECIES: type I-F CRISPR-associated protein Csy1 [Acinetobacter]|uniref:CRISPR type I-f/ypest-associated protein csy1 n=3 Tax=Acinetobacter TaxID=469 RepID=N8QE65_9GAMM|nr:MULTISPECIES: type I-F CRISPR-associated protein Csy1 [Acinetobacter]ENU36865.1 CRISPR type I-f/ypest-associated protein csy1 [Acinetobacter parvus DSM 16617 = CIP 108168]ENU84696.1 CRISPR type I-f/ypest-associated protein csy1 [Acinetobacter sp. CIP 102159]ENU90132.1 CRISPR type I-f/ypest-associated protein csy1 [Acinetobacter sp. CIP 102529]ENU94465.1 CRISPR type I-f/ypest-associated protein csy1 [Acinetobacter sp. CIP 102082]MCU4612778.1 type I-F CRISPR-associated protein Csy1 [Acinetoba
MTESIQNFLNERKELWLKDRLKKAENDSVISELQGQADDKFSLKEWLPDAAKRVTQLSMVSHPSKFSHPSAKTSSVIAQAKQINDGYLRSGNVSYPLDVFGNAAAMDVFKFLSLPLTEKLTVLDGFERQEESLKTLLVGADLDFETLGTEFLKIKATDTSVKTDHLVKQVYFPIEQAEYHLLSVLTPSGLITRLKQSIDTIRFSEETKQAKELRRKNEHHEIGYADIFDLTITAYGGTQPQNVSVLNSQNAGRAYLLSSCPPMLEKRAIRLPKTDFFAQCLYRKNYQESFIQLHKFMQLDLNNDDIRTAIRNIIQFVIDQILVLASKTREYSVEGWSNQDYYASLPKLQRIWLDKIYQTERDEDDDWRNDLSKEIARWILRSYEKVISDAYKLGTGEILDVKQRVEKSLQQAKEFF